MATKVLLTGATGFIGRGIARDLHRAGNLVASLVRGTDPEARLERAEIPGRALPGDLADRSAVARALGGANVVVHAAALVDPKLHGDPRAVRHVNRDLTIELARDARNAGARRFVFVSSIAAMGFWSGVARSESPCRPVSEYGRAKLEAERALLAMVRPGFDVVVLRPPTVYGPGEPYNFLTFVQSVERGLFRIVGSGKNHFPLVTTGNVTRTVRAAAEGKLPSGVYLVADREPYTLGRIHAAILVALGKPRVTVRLPLSVALAAGVVNEALRSVWPGAPLVLSRARVRTMTVDQRFDVSPLIARGVELDAPLEEWVDLTVQDYARRGVLGLRRGALRARPEGSLERPPDGAV